MTAVVLEQERALVAIVPIDPGAFAVLCDQHVDRVYAYAWQCLHDRLAAEGAVTETFHRAVQNVSRHDWRDLPVTAWLFQIASHVIAARYRQPATLPREATGELRDRVPEPAAQVLRAEQPRALQMAVAALPLLQQQVLSLYYGQDLCDREIAVILERSEGTIKQALYRARRRLRHSLVARADDEDRR